MQSGNWLLVTAFAGAFAAAGGIVAAFGNYFHTLTKAEEAKRTLAKSAREILRPEVATNMIALERFQVGKLNQTVPLHAFDLSAWKTVGQSGLLVGFDPDEVTAILSSYSLLDRANTLHAKLIDLQMGPAASMSNFSQNRTLILNGLHDSIEQIGETLLQLYKKLEVSQ